MITPSRYKLIQYLPWMFDYKFEVQSRRPEAITSYDALIYPFDKYIWYFTSSSMLVVFFALLIIQKCWVHASGKRLPTGWGFQGDGKCFFSKKKNMFMDKIGLDLIVSLTPVIDETPPYGFYQRSSFTISRQLLLIQWIIWANILSHAYKGTLLSTLINIRYTDPLDTIDQMDASGLPLFVFGGTAMEWLAKTDPREGVKHLWAKHVIIPFDGKIDEKYLQM